MKLNAEVENELNQTPEPDRLLVRYGRNLIVWLVNLFGPLLVFEDLIFVDPTPFGLVAKVLRTLGLADSAISGIGFMTAVGFLIWWVVALTQRQTPGRQLFGMGSKKDIDESSG